MEFGAGDINGALMMGMMALTVSVPASIGARPESAAPYIGGMLGAFVFAAGLLTYAVDVNPEGQPYRQILLASLCLGVALIALPRMILRLTMAGLLIPAGMFLASQYNSLVASDDWTGIPEIIAHRNRAREEALIQQLQYQLPSGGQLGDSQGWLLEMPAAQQIAEPFRGELEAFTRTETFSQWHTPLTGLYANRPKPMAVWYDGGGVFEVVPMDSRTETRPSSAPHRGRGPLLGDKSPYQR